MRQNPRQTTPRQPRRRMLLTSWPAIGLLGVLAFGPRCMAAHGELWLDEIWSVFLVRQSVRNVTEVLTVLQHDNNHFLNSLWIFLLPETASDFDYRILSLVAGSLTVVVAVLIVRQSGQITMLVTAAVFLTSFLQVHYSSEARGYASLCCCILLAVRADQNGRRGAAPVRDAMFSLCCVVGFLSHAAFLQFWLPAAAVTVWGLVRKAPASASRPGRGAELWKIICRLLVPGFFFLWLWQVNLSAMQIGGGITVRYADVILDTMSLAIGGPANSAAGRLSAGVMLLLSLFIVRHLWRTDSRQAFLLVNTAVVVPAMLLLLMQRQDIYPRYFLAGTVLFQLGFSQWVASLITTSDITASDHPWSLVRKGAGVCLLIAFLGANLVHDARLIRLQRGHYQEALEWMAQHSDPGPVVVDTDHRFRHGMLLSWYAPGTSLSDRLTMSGGTQTIPDWLLRHDPSRSAEPLPHVTRPGGQRFALERVFPTAPLSGWDLLVYRRLPASDSHDPAAEQRSLKSPDSRDANN